MSQKYQEQVSRLQQQNRRMQNAIDHYIQQIDHLKSLNTQHQKEIQSLLKFNERLLTIIEEEVNNNNNSRVHERSLQPISEVTEVDSEAMQQMMQSLQKTRNKLAARSQKGTPYLSSLQHHSKPSNVTQNNKVLHYMKDAKDLERSERYVNNDKEYSEFGNKSSFSKKRERKAINNAKSTYDQNDKKDFEDDVSIQIFQRGSTEGQPFQFNLTKAEEQDQKKQVAQVYEKIQENIQEKISGELDYMRKNSDMNHCFLDEKIERLKKLSQQISYNPEKKFNQLTSKFKLSPQMAAMVKKAMVKTK